MGIFETEHLCRWVHTVLPPIIKSETWEELAGDVAPPRRPNLGVSLDPNGQRASAVLSWQQDDGRVAVRLIADVTGDPIDVPTFGADLKQLAQDYKVKDVRYDPATDAELAKYFKKPDRDQRGEAHQRQLRVRQPRRRAQDRVGRRSDHARHRMDGPQDARSTGYLDGGQAVRGPPDHGDARNDPRRMAGVGAETT